jgi:hypothetical protein
MGQLSISFRGSPLRVGRRSADGTSKTICYSEDSRFANMA